jgi:hypothetical protein
LRLGPDCTARTAHNIGDHQGRERAENSGADTIEQLDADQPEAVVGKVDSSVAQPLKIMKNRACVIEILSCILETRAPSL